MSYILEALRKSEQERNPQKVPDLETQHRHVSMPQNTKFPYWILGIVLLLSNSFLVFYLWTKNTAAPTIQTIPLVVAAVPEEIIVKDIPKNTTLISEEKPDNVEIKPEQQAVKNNFIKQQSTVIPSTENSLDRAAIPDISDLPFDFQQQIPDMEYSTHIYVKDGGSFIIVNGKSLSEGMNVVRSVRLLQIVSDGIVLEFNGRRFFLAAMTNWQQN